MTKEDRELSLKRAIVFLETSRLHVFKAALPNMGKLPQQYEDMMKELKRLRKESVK